MKTRLILLLTFIVSTSAYNLQVKAQTLYVPGGTGGIGNNAANGNVGIGISTPGYKLNVFGNHYDSRILLHSTGGGMIRDKLISCCGQVNLVGLMKEPV